MTRAVGIVELSFMIFFDGQKSKADETKKRSLLGLLFNPRIDRDIAPLRESTGMFVRFIAMVFASYRLFPKDHPAMNDMTQKLTLREVIGIAYSNLTFTRQSLPQTIMFFAVVGILAFSAIFIVLFTLSLFTGTAHAQSMFTAPNPACDYALSWIDFLFMSGNVNSTCSTDGFVVPNSQAVQEALREGLAFYSKAILIFAGLILLYHLTSMVAETAHSGKPMGRANQIWAPIRLVVAIGLLVPISSGSSSSGGSANGAGLNTGQYIVVHLSKLGSGLASRAWDGFLGALSTQFDSMGFVTPPPPETDHIVKSMIKYAGCVHAYNSTVNSLSGIDKGYIIPWPSIKTVNESWVDEYGIEHAGKTYPEIHFQSTNKNVSCGSIRLATEPEPSGAELDQKSSAIYQGAITAYKKLFNTLSGHAVVTSGAVGELNAAYRGTVVPLTGEQIVQMTNDLIKTTRADVVLAIRSPLSGANPKINISTIRSGWSEQGWVMAGAWFNTIARAQGGLFDQVNTSFSVKLSPPSLEYSIGTSVGGLLGRMVDSDSSKIVDAIDDSVANSVLKFSQIVDRANPAADLSVAAAGADASKKIDLNFIADAVFGALDLAGKHYGLWDEKGVVKTFGNKANPMAEVAAYGYNMFEYGTSIMAVAGASTVGLAVAGAVLGAVTTGGTPIGAALGAAGATAISQIGGGFFGFVMAIAGIMTTAGIMMGFYVPLIPYIRFFFHVITWLLSIMGAVVAAPLFALAHLTPYGDGLPGGMAQKGYFFLLSIMIRPILNVFGLIAGLLLFFIAINFLNLSFGIATAGTGAMAGGLAVVSKIVFCVIYSLLVYICANNCFKTIGYFAERGMDWMNASAWSGENLGDKHEIQRGVLLSAGYAGHKAGDVIMKAAEGIGGGVKTAIDKRKELIKAGKDELDERTFQASLSGKNYNPETRVAEGGSSANLGAQLPNNMDAGYEAKEGKSVLTNESASKRQAQKDDPAQKSAKSEIEGMRQQLLKDSGQKLE